MAWLCFPYPSLLCDHFTRLTTACISSSMNKDVVFNKDGSGCLLDAMNMLMDSRLYELPHPIVAREVATLTLVLLLRLPPHPTPSHRPSSTLRSLCATCATFLDSTWLFLLCSRHFLARMALAIQQSLFAAGMFLVTLQPSSIWNWLIFALQRSFLYRAAYLLLRFAKGTRALLLSFSDNLLQLLVPILLKSLGAEDKVCALASSSTSPPAKCLNPNPNPNPTPTPTPTSLPDLQLQFYSDEEELYLFETAAILVTLDGIPPEVGLALTRHLAS